MRFLETKYQKKSAFITTIVMILILAAVFVFGLKYLDPPEEYGIAINFGTSDVGSGKPKIIESVKSAPQKVQPQKKVVEETKEVVEKKVEATPKEQVEDVVTQNTKEAPVINKKKKIDPKVIEAERKAKIKREQEAKRKKLDALMNGLQKDGDAAEGEGDDNESGLKGKENGDPNSSKYYGNGGNDGDGNYNLSGRKALTKPIYKPDCNEEGVVVVSIEVDNKGNVIKATAGVKGSTNTAPCLLKPAKEAAMKTKWNADGGAPVKQVGTIIYRFTLTE